MQSERPTEGGCSDMHLLLVPAHDPSVVCVPLPIHRVPLMYVTRFDGPRPTPPWLNPPTILSARRRSLPVEGLGGHTR